ncbi:hypothetical protein GCM10009127_09920 [Alteraurantiacibacter aestuarii]|uniref:Cytochrome c n=1 Tax=Alteraurantiacibacter aestuarii TaxID=650004 RepID=A0A844ZK21_9SPHN|nr:cytochrome c [Alteraurantiacibacter aestuarii]MXO87380.1 cytochrome c [Alteraurantiacibacter aestuarii]
MRILTATSFVAASLALSACSGGEAEQAATGGPPPMPQPVTMAQRPDATGGEALYVEFCAMCHAPNGMGTGLIARRADVSLLEERDDLTVELVVLSARNGIGNMPAIPRGEVSDEQLQQIAEYLAAGPHGGAQ